MTVLAAAASSTSAWDQPGTLGFLVVFGLAIILYFVFRSLVKQLRKVNEAARAEAERLEADQADGGPGQASQAGSEQAQVEHGSPEFGSREFGNDVKRPAGNGSSRGR